MKSDNKKVTELKFRFLKSGIYESSVNSVKQVYLEFEEENKKTNIKLDCDLWILKNYSGKYYHRDKAYSEPYLSFNKNSK